MKPALTVAIRIAFVVATGLCVFAVIAHAQRKEEDRIFYSPPSFYKGEAFLELSESGRMEYTSGLMDGFFGSALFGATDETVATLTSCTKGMDNKQLSAILTKYVKDHPEVWHLPMSVQAYNALNGACPGVLRIIDSKN